MRLIDADKVIVTRYDYEKPLTLKERLYRLLDNQPTVEAIPIEWIKNYLHELEIISKDNLDLGEDGYFSEIVTIEDMLAEWEKENE